MLRWTKFYSFIIWSHSMEINIIKKFLIRKTKINSIKNIRKIKKKEEEWWEAARNRSIFYKVYWNGNGSTKYTYIMPADI